MEGAAGASLKSLEAELARLASMLDRLLEGQDRLTSMVAALHG